uniref:Uncharacterized protein n=1 Tax=Arundo donax TaxID=35708 RepID=A0A0A8Z740_ARUDO
MVFFYQPFSSLGPVLLVRLSMLQHLL